MRLWALFIAGILLIIAGLQGNPGSMIGALIDPANMDELTGGANFGPAQGQQQNQQQQQTLGTLLGGVAR